MFVAVIRGDLSKPLFVADVEPKSTANPSTEAPLGQAKYISRPDLVKVQAYLDSQAFVVRASDLIAATVPVGGPVDVSPTAIKAVTGLSKASRDQVQDIQSLLAYKFVETDVAKKSFLYGNLYGFRSSGFNPDPRRTPALANGPAIAVVQDDGVSLFTVSVPTIVTADKDTPTAGALRISGSGFTGSGLYEATVVLVGPGGKKLTKAAILAGGGSLTDSQIDIPAALIQGTSVGYTNARVMVNNVLSNSVALS